MRELLIYSLLPVLLIAIYIYNKDKNKEPKEIIKKLLIGGALSVILVLIITYVMGLFIDIYRRDATDLQGIDLIIYCYIVVALSEESSKMLMLYNIGYKSKYYDESYDMLLYGGFIGLGFAALENVFYVSMGGLTTALVRAFTAIPFHTILGIIMGYYLNKYNKNKNNQNIALSLLIPVILHGTYDYYLLHSLNGSNEITSYCLSLLITIICLIILLYFIIKLLNKTSQESIIEQPTMENNNYEEAYCPNCGAKYESKFCKNCGRKRQ